MFTGEFELFSWLVVSFWFLKDLVFAILSYSAEGSGGGVAFAAHSGGFVAGIRAGFAYNTFPLMNGHVVPPEIMLLEPWWKNFFYNMATVQFDHRAGAWLLAVLVPVAWWNSCTSSPVVRRAADLLLAMLVVQIALGISTLLLVVPVGLAATHQAGAVLLFTAALNLLHSTYPRPAAATPPA